MEWKLIHLALHHPGAANQVRETVRPDEVEDETLRRIFQSAVMGTGAAYGPTPLAMEEPEVQRVLTELLATDLEEYDGEKAIERALSDCLARVKARGERRVREALQRRMEEAERAGDHKTVEQLQAQFLALTSDRTRRADQPSA